MLIGSLIKNLHGAIMTGIGIAVVTAAISGIMTPYSALPSLLQKIATVLPVSTANSSLTLILTGEEFAGYNPLNVTQLTLSVCVTVVLFAAGLMVYSRYAWKKS
jgi:hypothetical protein